MIELQSFLTPDVFATSLKWSVYTPKPLPVSYQSRRGLCEEALLKIRGVISFTFQMAVKRCVVRIRSDLKAEVSV